MNGGGDHISDARLWNTSQSCKHGQELSPCHPLYQSIKLRTVANLLLDLRPIFVALSQQKSHAIHTLPRVLKILIQVGRGGRQNKGMWGKTISVCILKGLLDQGGTSAPVPPSMNL